MALALHKKPLLSERTTLRLGGHALAELCPASLRDLEEVPQLLEKIGGTPAILGRGSNILASDGELPLVLIAPKFTSAPQLLANELCPSAQQPTEEMTQENALRVHVGANVPLPLLLNFLQRAGASGLEGLSGIPGQVGGALAMNAGSYGCEINNCMESIELFSPDTGAMTVQANECNYGYRHFSVPKLGKAWFIMTGVTLRLTRKAPNAVQAAMQEAMAKKCASQPVQAHSAGCIFQNPAQGVSAGAVLENVGFRGKYLRSGQERGMRFSPVHANFLVNEGGGTAEEALELIHLAQEAVQKRYGYSLHMEVKWWH